jgi:heptosyltransferase-2/heptosyltransferase-3
VSLRQVLVLRLDRVGDVIMSLPALRDLRAALPQARIRLAVGRWSETIARSAPVDEVLVWNAPWVGRGDEGAHGSLELVRQARALRAAVPDLALDLQGDVRASALLWLTRARIRVGYANTGGGYLLTHVVPLDETVSWVEQNRRAVETVTGARRNGVEPRAFQMMDVDRGFAQRLFGSLGLDARRPLVGIHPSGGRLVKQWSIERWAAVAARLQRELGATILVTGSAADRALAERLGQELTPKPIDLAGRLALEETLSVIAHLDLFLSPDTGPMHMACALGTPSVSVFGPSDPVRYFSGGDPAPGGRPGSRHVVVRGDLWCSPCNLIRVPPRECSGAEGPECLRLVTAEEVGSVAVRLLRERGVRAQGDA